MWKRVLIGLAVVFGFTYLVAFIHGSLQKDAKGNAEVPNLVLAQLEAQHADLAAQASKCQAALAEWNTKQQQALMAGYAVPYPSCAATGAQVAAQMAFLENVIYRIKTGDYKSSPCEINGISVPACESGAQQR